MRPFKGLINADEAMDIINKNVRAIEESEDINIDTADRRILAEDVKATYDVPHFNRSSMDGYAVRSEDTSEASMQHPKMLTIVGEVFAGDSIEIQVRKGE
jgi:molybdopterin molybdotransferase